MKNFSGLTITGATSDGYSVKANGYVKGSWLQSSVMQNYGSNTGKVCVFDNSGWIYYRTPAEIVAEAGGGGSTEVVQTTGTSTTSVMSQKATTDAVNGRLSKTENTNIEVLGTKKATTTLGGNQLVAPNGIIFAGTAANAGLVTRGICGVSTPDSKGACSKENLYINYDGNNDFNAGRQVVLNAGAVGNHLGSNMYQYAVPRGDIVKAWVEAQGYAKISDIPTANNGTLTIQKNGTTVATFSANQSGNATANITVPTFSLSGTTLTITI